MSNGAHVTSGADAQRESGLIAVQSSDFERINMDRRRLEFHWFAGASQLVSGFTCNFFGREGRGYLLHGSVETCCYMPDLLKRQFRICSCRRWFTLGVVGVRSKSETDGTCVGFFS